MGFLEKLGLVVSEEPEVGIVAPEAPVVNPAPEVDADIKSTNNIISEIYKQNEMEEMDESIYAVKAFIETLPSEMTTAKKQSTVSGILAVSKISVADLVTDALSRMDVLRMAQAKVVDERTAEIAAANADIEALKQAIEAATIKIKNAEEIIAATKKSIEDEVGVITGLVEFCNGMEVK